MADQETPGIDYARQANRLHWPPLLYALTLAGSYGLQRLMPLPRLALGPWQLIFGGALVAAGVALAVVAIAGFLRAKTPVDPTAQAKVLVASGIYRLTRNPMYLGAVLAFAGIALMLGASWLLALVPIMAICLHLLAIRREERHLEVRFGAAYREYKDRTSRWIWPI